MDLFPLSPPQPDSARRKMHSAWGKGHGVDILIENITVNQFTHSTHQLINLLTNKLNHVR